MMRFNDIVKLVADEMPTFNEHALVGAAEDQINNSPEFIATVFREGFKLVDDDIELVKYTILSPEDRVHFELKSKQKGQNKQDLPRIPLTVSHLSLVRYTIRHRQEYIHREIYTPYLNNHMLTINSRHSMIKKVIIEQTFSRVQDKDVDGIQISPIRVNAKFNRRHTHRIYSYLDKESYSHFIITAQLWHGNKRSPICERTVVHYLLAKFGFDKTLRHFGLTRGDVSFSEKVNDDTKKFEYFAARPFDGNIEDGPGLYLKVKRELMYEDQPRKFIVNLMYVLNFFNIQSIDNVYGDDAVLWKTILGVLTHNERNQARAHNNAITHLRSVDHFIDPITLKRFRSFGLLTGENDDIYDLLVYIFIHIDEYMAKYEAQDIYNCRLDMSQGLLVESFARKINWNIYGLVRKNNITHKDVKDALRLSAMMFKLNSTGKKDDSEQYLSPPDIVGDNLLFAGGLGKIRLNGRPEQRLHPSMLVVESINAFVGKPIGKTGYMNPYVQTTANGTIIHPDYAASIDALLPYIPR